MRITGAPFPPTPLYSLSCPLTGPQFSRAARSVHLAELKVLGLERFLDLRLAVPRRVLLRLLLLRGRGRARGQAVQHLPDVEFPHGLGGAPPRPGRGGKRRPRAGGGDEPGPRAASTEERERVGVRGEAGSWGEAKENPNRKYCDDERAAATRAPGGDPSCSEAAAAVAPLRPPPPPPRSAARRLSSGGGAPSRLRRASPGRGLTLRRAAAPGRPRCRRRRVHGPRPRRSSPAPAPQSLGASSRSRSCSCSSSRGVAGSPSAAAARLPSRSAPLPGRHRTQGARGGSPRSPPRASAAGSARPRFFRAPAAFLRRRRRPRSRPAAPSRPTGRLGTRHQRPPGAAAAAAVTAPAAAVAAAGAPRSGAAEHAHAHRNPLLRRSGAGV